ncbi:MAG: hypothetical protein EBS12_06885 [Flavobacteriia bacterium]|nr:hypothetical protein [Flavobacteriia bacterium]
MKTAVQQVFSDLEKLHPNLFNVYTTEGKEFINHFHKYLEMEKQQIIKAYESLEHRHGENYYNETFKQQEQ